MKNAARAAALLSLLQPSCGGSGSSPTSPSTPAPAANSIDLIVTPAQGSTVSVTECDGDCTSALHIRFDVRYSQSVAGAEVYSQLFDAAGRMCAFNFTDTVSLVAGQLTSFNTDVYVIQCEGSFTTTRGRATLFGPNTTGATVASRPGLLAGDFTGGWTFNRPQTPTSGGTPNPNPNPNPTPKPTPTPPPSSATCSGGSVPAQVACGVPTAGCKDGSWSCSQNRTGTCSSHNGVSCWVCPGPLC